MRLNPLSGLRGKMLLLFIASFLLSIATTASLLALAFVAVYLDIGPIVEILQMLHYNIGIVPILMATAACLFCIYVVVIGSRYVKYLTEIMNAVEQMSTGDLSIRIPVKSDDEMGQLADRINKMARHLQSSIEEERQAVQAKNELITNVSHDLRTPLTSIVGYLELMDSDQYKDEVELRHYVNIVFGKSKRLTRLVNELFEYTRVNYGKLQLKSDRLNAIELLGQLAAEYTFAMEQAGMTIELDFRAERLIVLGDGDQLMRLFENLISNAFSYGKDGKRIVLSAYEQAGSAVVHVVNFGPPIPAADLPHVFDRFYRVEKSRSTETGGTGLGLAIAKGIVELHGGQIAVQSDSASTRFEVVLPLVEALQA